MDSLLGNLRDLVRRVPDIGRGFFDAFVRDNKVLPPVMALLALFLFAWVVAGAFVDEQDGENAGQADLVQSRNQEDGVPISPESEDRDADSYAAYRSKDPFRQLLAPAGATEDTTGDTTSGDTTSGDTTTGDTTDETTTGTPETTTGTPGGGNGGGGGGGGGDGQRSRADSDGDGVTNRKEERLGLDPRNPDTDGDGTQDGDDDSDGDGVPDGQRGGGGNGGSGGNGGGGGGGAGNGDDDLLDSGGVRGKR